MIASLFYDYGTLGGNWVLNFAKNISLLCFFGLPFVFS